MRRNQTILSLLLLILLYGTVAQKRALQAQANAPAFRHKMPCRRPGHGQSIVRHR